MFVQIHLHLDLTPKLPDFFTLINFGTAFSIMDVLLETITFLSVLRCLFTDWWEAVFLPKAFASLIFFLMCFDLVLIFMVLSIVGCTSSSRWELFWAPVGCVIFTSRTGTGKNWHRSNGVNLSIIIYFFSFSHTKRHSLVKYQSSMKNLLGVVLPEFPRPGVSAICTCNSESLLTESVIPFKILLMVLTAAPVLSVSILFGFCFFKKYLPSVEVPDTEDDVSSPSIYRNRVTENMG